MEGNMKNGGEFRPTMQRHEMQPHKIGARKSFRIDIEHLWEQKKDKIFLSENVG